MRDEPLHFDRVLYVCPICGEPGLIEAAWLSLTRVKLEGRCAGGCGTHSVRDFDLLTIDRWLNHEVPLPC